MTANDVVDVHFGLRLIGRAADHAYGNNGYPGPITVVPAV